MNSSSRRASRIVYSKLQQISAGSTCRIRTTRASNYWHNNNRRFYHPAASTASSSPHLPSLRKEDKEDDRKKQQYHVTARSDRAVAIILGLGALSAASYGAATAVRTWNAYQIERAADLEKQQQEEAEKKQTESEEPPKQQEGSSETKKKNKDEKQDRENIFESWFGVGVGSKYYEGGFEEKMTRREAALILGVRESASVARIKDAHRKLTIANHPDTGGSTYMSGKINEAKELLLKGRKG